MINRQLQTVKVISKSGKDEYGQRHIDETAPRFTFLTIGLYEHSQNSDIRYADCKYVGLTKDTTLTDNDYLVYEGKEHKSEFINPYGRWVQVFFK